MNRARRCGGHHGACVRAVDLSHRSDAMDQSIIIIADDEILIAPLADDEDLPEDDDPLVRLGLTADDLPF
jgi:hypothetical protein